MKTGQIKTSKGVISVALFDDDAPQTVANFVALAERGYYDGLVFHRVIADFMCQTGCPEGTGRGGPGHTVADELNSHKHLTGTLSMANKGTPNSGGSQFFICHRPLPDLDGKHTVFGRLTQGIPVLFRIEQGDALEGISIAA